MADLIKIKSGAKGNREKMPKLEVGELGYATDEKALYIGTASGNVRLCGADDYNAIMTEINGIKAEITQIKADITEIQALLNKPSE